LASENLQRVLERIEALADNLAGDVKKLTDYTPEYRLRVGGYRSCSRSTVRRSPFTASSIDAKPPVSCSHHD
jgi:hypothetical protein